MTIHKAAPAVVTAPATRTLTYTGSAQKLVEAGSADAGTLYYAVTTENQAPADDLYSTSIPEGTHAGTYYVWYKVKGDASHTDTEPVCIQVTISEGGTYAYISGDGDTWTKSSGLPLTFRVKNSGDDSETFRNFKGVKVDGKPLTNGQQYGASRGSVVIKLKPVCLETLSVGEHALTAEFKDGRAEAG